ncbi:hypothetical protein OG225_12345 [Nocardia sp. NBC_01377]|uniref:hypothetical protein n=1 Tax=Nocardia sp. NBC_01377 TaxID=2903595 RepID=UPI0032440442
MTVTATTEEPGSHRRRQSPIYADRYDTTAALRAREKEAITELGLDNLRRLARHDPTARGWRQVRRLVRPLDDAAAALRVPVTSHRRRATLDATAVVLLHCAQTGRVFWSWTEQQWAGLIGADSREFRAAVPGWADDAVRPYLAAHAFLLGGFTAFYRLGSFSRLTLAWNIFGRERVIMTAKSNWSLSTHSPVCRL